jgi:excisionase family DNA binding protein
VIEWNGEKLRTAAEVATLLGCNVKAVYAMSARGVLPGRRVGKWLLFGEAELDALLGPPPAAPARPRTGRQRDRAARRAGEELAARLR